MCPQFSQISNPAGILGPSANEWKLSVIGKVAKTLVDVYFSPPQNGHFGSGLFDRRSINFAANFDESYCMAISFCMRLSPYSS